MRLNGREITVHTGETFGIDFTLRNKDGSPYIVSSEYENPYFLIAISNTKFKQRDRYLLNYWDEINYIPTFYSTVATKLNGTSFPASPPPRDFPKKSYENNGTNYYDPTSLYYIVNSNGRREYKFWKYHSEDVETGDWIEYECRIIKTFPQDVTANWTGHIYFYSITLVGGELMTSYLQSLCEDKLIDYIGLTDDGMYEALLEVGVKFDDEFQTDRALGRIDLDIPILPPTTITVLTSINGEF